MDVKRFFTARAVVWLVLGLLGGGIAGDIWWRQHARDVKQQLNQLQRSVESERTRAGALESALSACGAEMKHLKEEVERLTKQLNVERDLRHRYEDLVSRGRK
jgi:uncharacterized protein HemX